MKPRKPFIGPNTLVWRISEGSPSGEWVEKKAPVPPPVLTPHSRDLPEVRDGSWVSSSFDLLSGSETSEVSDTIPGDLFDELFPSPPPESPKSDDK